MTTRNDSGGYFLKQLREQAGLKRQEVEKRSAIGRNNLGKYESETRYPERDTLKSILDAIGPPFHDRCRAFKNFGFKPDMPIPTEEEIALTCRNCQPYLDKVKDPACLLDMRGYFLAWNTQFPKLLRMSSVNLNNRVKSRNPTLIEALVNPNLRLMQHLENADGYLPHAIQGFKHDLCSHEEECWYKDLIAQLTRYKRFNYHWDQLTSAPSSEIDMRQQYILQFRMHDRCILSFRLMIVPVFRDERFQILRFILANERTE